MADEHLEELRRLIVAGGIITMCGAIYGLSQLGIATETLFYSAPLLWLIGIVVCGFGLRFMAWCTKKKNAASVNRRDPGFQTLEQLVPVDTLGGHYVLPKYEDLESAVQDEPPSYASLHM